MKKPCLLLLVLTLSLLGPTSCRSSDAAADALGPGFVGQFASDKVEFDARLKVVSYNISFSEKSDLAAQELLELKELRDADIVLLQEMDETGTTRIAQALANNFVYFPASIHDRHGRYFGNAILSRWPIRDQERVLLPHKNPVNGQRRIATRAVVTLDGQEVLVYSVHTETPWLSARKRADQVAVLVKSIGEGYPCVIVGGDFNTLTPGSVTALEQRFERAGLQRASSPTAPTIRFNAIELTLDHIFVRGMPVLAAGTAEDAAASDHLPVWVILQSIR